MQGGGGPYSQVMVWTGPTWTPCPIREIAHHHPVTPLGSRCLRGPRASCLWCREWGQERPDPAWGEGPGGPGWGWGQEPGRQPRVFSVLLMQQMPDPLIGAQLAERHWAPSS